MKIQTDGIISLTTPSMGEYHPSDASAKVGIAIVGKAIVGVVSAWNAYNNREDGAITLTDVGNGIPSKYIEV